MGRWMDGWMDRWVGGWMDLIFTLNTLDIVVNGKIVIDRWMDGWIGGWVGG